jgi:hypothetical protein
MKCMYNIPCKNRRLQIRKIRYYHHYSKRTALSFIISYPRSPPSSCFQAKYLVQLPTITTKFNTRSAPPSLASRSGQTERHASCNVRFEKWFEFGEG